MAMEILQIPSDLPQKTVEELSNESFSTSNWGGADLEDIINGNFIDESSSRDYGEADLPVVAERRSILKSQQSSFRTVKTDASSTVASEDDDYIEPVQQDRRKGFRRLGRSQSSRVLSNTVNTESPCTRKGKFCFSSLVSPRQLAKSGRVVPRRTRSLMRPSVGDEMSQGKRNDIRGSRLSCPIFKRGSSLRSLASNTINEDED